jgi:hypothetical protein
MSNHQTWQGPDPSHHWTRANSNWAALTRTEARQIFRRMVEVELRNGQLNTYRRKRLVGFAASLHLSALDSGRLIQEAVREFERSGSATTAGPSLRLVQPHVSSGFPWAGVLTGAAVVAVVYAVSLAF